MAKKESQKKTEVLFKKATHLLFPELSENDPRFMNVVKYAKKIYYKNPEVKICVLCAILGHTTMFYNFYWFCQKQGLNSGRREVIISDEKLFYSKDYTNWPTEVKLSSNEAEEFIIF